MKKLSYHFCLFIVLGIASVLLLTFITYWNPFYSLIFYIIMFFLVKLIYYLLSKKITIDKTRNKILTISSIVIVLIIFFSLIFCVSDYIFLKVNKKPFFSHQNMGWSIGDNKPTAAVYSGLGYKIVECDVCQKEVYLMPLGIGRYPYEYYDCEYNNDLYQFTFADGNIKDISERFETEELEENNLFNEFENCGYDYMEYNNKYEVSSWCDLSGYTIEEIKLLYPNIKSLTRNEFIKEFENENENFKCKLKKY